jgi:hypothetical protein
MEPDDPARKTYGFKMRDFKRDNVRGPGVEPLPTAKELAIMAGPVVATPKGATGPKAGDPNDVFNHLQENREKEKLTGGDTVEIRKIKSRRRRDYWLLLIGGNLALVAGVALNGFNIISAIFGLAGLIIFSLGVTWIMWQVMDRY